jgi:hypothetical protein
MPNRCTRRSLCQYLARTGGLVGAFLAASCGGSYVSSTGSPVAIPTNVVGKSDTSGISAGSLQASPTPKP